MSEPESNRWYLIKGDCRVPPGHLLSRLEAQYLALPHVCTEQEPCPSREQGL